MQIYTNILLYNMYIYFKLATDEPQPGDAQIEYNKNK